MTTSGILKSLTCYQVPGEGWTLRLRLTDGRELFFNGGRGPYTLAQAELARLNALRDMARHGEQHFLESFVEQS